MIEINDPVLGKLTWEPTQEFSKLIKLDNAKVNVAFRSLMSSILLAHTIDGELNKKAHDTMRISLHCLSIALNQLASIAEGKQPYPLVHERDMNS